MIKTMFVLSIILSPITSMAQEVMSGSSSGYVRVILEYKSMFPGTIQVIDKVCGHTINIECIKAGIKLDGESCQQKPAPSECKEAKDLLATSFCMEGLVYEGRVSDGVKVKVDLCKSEGGFGNMSVRNVSSGVIWTNYFLLSEGQTVSFP